MSRIALVIAIALSAGNAAAQQGHTVKEVEPNGTPTTATVAAVGDTLSGVVNPTGDTDWFAIQLPAGVTVTLTPLSGTHSLDVQLVDTDGHTGLAPLGSDEPLRPLSYPITVSGRYYFELSGKQGFGSPTWVYNWVVSTQPLSSGPGDPLKNVGGTMAAYWAVATPTGDFLVLTAYGAIKRMSKNGAVSDFAALPTDYPNKAMGGFALDGSGDVLVTAIDSSQHSVVWKFSSTGQRSLFTAVHAAPNYQHPAFVTIGPDGDVWVGPSASFYGDTTSQRIWRFDASGALKDSTDFHATHVRAVAFSPSGDLVFSANGGLYKLSANQAVQLMATDAELSSLAFDRDGYLYAIAGIGFNYPTPAEAIRGRVVLYDPQYRHVTDIFAHAPYAWRALLFGRNADGTMEQRLFVMVQPLGNSELAEVNAAGVRAPGFPLGKQGLAPPPQIAVQDIVNALTGGPALTAAQVQYLDSLGNHNGVLDVGDLRAYLRAQGKLAGSRQP